MDWGIIALIVVALFVAPFIGGIFHTASHVGDFADLGDIRGKPIADIISRVGQPVSISAVPEGQLYQWMTNVGFNTTHHAILVDLDGNAIGFTHQFVK